MKINDKILNDRYKIIGILGDGAYGDVYKIQRDNHIGNVYALKILKDNESIEKFERETKILDILKKHPNILKLEDCEIDNNTMYIIMPYINHGNLKEYIKANGTLSEDKAKIFLTQMLDAIEHANNQKEPIFHKDIKPENILLHKEEENDEIRYILADWGLASAKSGSRSVESSGTLDYKPPEVYKRKRYKNSDIYSLGIVLHYTLTKNSPYGYVMYSSELDEASIMFSHLQDEPDIDENLSHNMKTIISKMLIKEPNDRANIDELRELLKDDARESFEMGEVDFSIENTQEDEKKKEIEKLKNKIEQLEKDFKNSKYLDSQTQVLYEKAMNIQELEEYSNTNNTYIEPQPINIPNQSYQMAKYTVTFKEYDKYCEDTNTKKPEDRGWGRENRPVINVNWNDAKEYASWLSKKTNKTYRLPTEKEWEYCCKAGTTTDYSFGNDKKELDKYGWYDKNSYDKGFDHKDYGTHPVGEKLPNPWGLFDMHGNVWEWCEDWYDSNKDEKVLRGGSWYNSSDDLRFSVRSGNYPTYANLGVGFRLVCEP